MKSFLLVGIQFSLLFFLAWYGGIGNALLPNGLLWGGVLLGFSAVAAMRFRVSIMPEVRERQALVLSGPYRFIRHPMYTAVLLIAASFVVQRPESITFFAWGALLVDLLIKLRFEEQELVRAFPKYAESVKHVKRLIPGVY